MSLAKSMERVIQLKNEEIDALHKEIAEKNAEIKRWEELNKITLETIEISKKEIAKLKEELEHFRRREE